MHVKEVFPSLSDSTIY